MKKYLDEMTTEELIHLAMQECIFLELTFNREKTIKRLEMKGYERIRDKKSELLAQEEKASIKEETAHLEEENEEKALKEIREKSIYLQILGNYKIYNLEI